jgi:hypothetical protein
MLAIQLNINVLVLGGIVVGAWLLGFLIRRAQIAVLKKKVIELENEMLSNHSEILDLQRENASLEQQMKQLHIPVISMKKTREEKSAEQDALAKKIASGKDKSGS